MARYRAEHSYHLQLWQAQWLRACSLQNTVAMQCADGMRPEV